MASKAKVADVADAFGLADTMSIGDIWGKYKKNSYKSSNPLKDAGAKKERLASTEGVTSTRPTPTPVASPDVPGS
jgi:hypothetical protein